MEHEENVAVPEGELVCKLLCSVLQDRRADVEGVLDQGLRVEGWECLQGLHFPITLSTGSLNRLKEVHCHLLMSFPHLFVEEELDSMQEL